MRQDRAVDGFRLAPSHDPLFPAQWSDRIGDFFSSATLTSLDGAGHFTPLERPRDFAAAILEATAMAAGQSRDETIPADLADAIVRDEKANAAFAALPRSHRREWVRWVEEAKKPETRARRIAKTVESLRAGQPAS
jgi:Bacteriocin-protection, YdeI or OmpD-Associated